MLLNCLYVGQTDKKGRGVFTEQYIEAGTIVEIAPVLVLPTADVECIKKTKLYDYYFLWSETEEIIAIALGYGSIYNHSYTPNLFYETYYEDEKIHFIALRNIEVGEELTINYNHDPNDASPVWFQNFV